MEHEKQTPETTHTPEEFAVAQLNDATERIFADYTPTPSYTDQKSDEITDRNTGARLIRTTNEDSTTTYQLSMLVHTGTDRGAIVTSWSNSEGIVLQGSNMEIAGNTTPEAIDSQRVDAITSRLNTLFPEIITAPEKKSLLKRIMGKLAVNR